MVTVGSILSGTFGFVRDNVRAILVWSGLFFLLSLALMTIMRPFYAGQLAAMQAGTAAPPNFGPLLLMIVLLLVVMTVVWAAVFRAVLFPEQSRLAYLRLGMDELRLLGCVLVLLIAFYLLMLVSGIVLAILGAAIMGVGGAAGGVAAVGLAAVVLSLWLGTRFSLAGPLTILERKIIIGRSWRMTRGNFWRLLGAYLVIIVLLVVVYGGLSLLRTPGLATMFHPSSLEAQQQLIAAQAGAFSFSLKNIVIAIATSIVGGFALALHAGVTAVATAQLVDRRGEQHLSEVFE